MLSVVPIAEEDSYSPQPPSILNKRLYFHPKGDEIPLFPEGVWQVERGLVQLNANYDDGEQTIFGWADRGGWFGTQVSNIIDYQAIALSDLYLRWWQLEEIYNSPKLSQLLLPSMVRRMRQAETLLIINGRRRADQRLRGLLGILGQELGESLPNGKTRLNYKFTHQQLANAISTTRVTVSRMMSHFQAQDYITLDRSRHLILDDIYFQAV
jgi:CRP-like cAMP-binding protein